MAGLKQEILKVPIVTRYELLKQIRRSRLYGLLIVGAVISILVVALGAHFLAGTSGLTALTFSQFIISTGQVSFFALIAGVFFSGDAISSEFENRTGYLIFPNPIKRVTLLTGKYLSCCVAATLVVTMPYLIFSVGTVLIFGEFPSELLLSYLFTLLYVCAVVSLTFIFSALFKGSMGASVLPFTLLFFVFPIIRAVMMIGGIEPFMFLDYGAEISTSILTVPYPPHERMTLIGGGGTYLSVTIFVATIAEGAIIMISYLVVGLILSSVLMRRREMT